jgi:uncharacterized protein YukE
MSDDSVKIDTSALDDGASQLEEVATRLQQVVSALAALPDPKQAAGTGVDELSRSFMVAWAKMGGDNLMRLLWPGSGSVSGAEILQELAKSTRYAADLFRHADDQAAQEAAAALQAVLVKETGNAPQDNSSSS